MSRATPRVDLAGRDHRSSSVARLFAPLAAGILFTLACDGSSLLSALPTLEPFPTAEPIAWATLPVAPSTFVISPLFNLPTVPEDVLQPFAGNAPDWWYWVPVHPSARAGGETGGGFHYLVDLAPGDVLAYYHDALRQSGWAERMVDMASGDFSLLSYDRDGARADIYLSPHGASTLVSILVN